MTWQTLKMHVFGHSSPPFSAGRKIQSCALFSTAVMFLLNGIRIYDYIIDPHNPGLPLIVTLILLMLFLGLWLLARAGKPKLTAWLLIAAYALPTIFCFYFWGADLPAGILMSVLITVMAGLFLGPKQAFAVLMFFAAMMITFTHLQYYQLVKISSNWRLQSNHPADSVVYASFFVIIYLLAWLILRENRRSLRETEEAQQALREERDLLEIKVTERTRAITEMQREKIEQLQVLASIGQLSGGIFHDIVNPLTAVNLSLEQLKDSNQPDMDESRIYLRQALSATNRIKNLIESVNSCLKRQSRDDMFSIRAEILKVKDILAAKARTQNAVISIDAGDDIRIKGGETRFGQIFMNLISNALDACVNPTQDQRIDVRVKQSKQNDEILITVADTGIGIKADDLKNIFNAFFTTKKKQGKNLGLGLSIVKEIIETDFQGRVEVSSRPQEGTIFTVCIPQALTISN